MGSCQEDLPLTNEIMLNLRGIEMKSKQMGLGSEAQEKDHRQRYRLGRCSRWVVVEGTGMDATALGGCSEREVKEGLNPGRHQCLRGRQKRAQQRRMCFLP